MGFEMAGFRIAWTNEANSVFAKMYEHGATLWRRSTCPFSRPARITDQRRIESIPVCGIIKSAFPDGRPELFGIIGGPPCPDFSNGGKNRGGRGKHGRLSRIFVQHICKVRPDFFVFENVSALFRTKTHRRFLERLEHQLEESGFRIDMKILNALDMGVPQDRERLIVVGIWKSSRIMTAAQFNSLTNTLGFNQSKIPANWWYAPAQGKMLEIIVHELGHRNGAGHYEDKYHETLCEIAARLPRIAMSNSAWDW